jgi:hypothetical protein
VIPIKNQLDNVLFGHFGELAGKDVLKIEQELKRFMGAIVANDLKRDLMFFLLSFGGIVPGGKAEADVLNQNKGTYPCMPTKLLFCSLFPSTYICFKWVNYSG